MKLIVIIFGVLFSMSRCFAAEHLVEGASQSPVRVLIYEDLQCPDCADFRIMLDNQLLPKYAGTVAFEHRDFPLAKHAWARKAAIAARFFGEQAPEVAIAYRQQTMQNLHEITTGNFNERLIAFARDHKIDAAKAVAALDDKRLDSIVEEDRLDGIARGIAKTPTALVNGKPFIERFSFEEISTTIDSELAAAK